MKQRTINFHNQSLKVYERDDADASVVAEIFRLQEYRKAEEVIRNAKNPICDIGAHAGFFTLYCRALNPTVPIIALEPEEHNVVMLERHCKENHIAGVQMIKGALGGVSDKKGLLRIMPDNHNHYLVKTKEKDHTTVSTPIFCWGDVLKETGYTRSSLLKVDIEGGEYDVFESFSDKDFASIDALIMEYHIIGRHDYKEIEQQLREHGFGVEIFPSRFDKSMGFLWAHNKRI